MVGHTKTVRLFFVSDSGRPETMADECATSEAEAAKQCDADELSSDGNDEGNGKGTLTDHRALWDAMSDQHRLKYVFPRDVLSCDMTKEQRKALRMYKSVLHKKEQYNQLKETPEAHRERLNRIYEQRKQRKNTRASETAEETEARRAYQRAAANKHNLKKRAENGLPPPPLPRAPSAPVTEEQRQQKIQSDKEKARLRAAAYRETLTDEQKESIKARKRVAMAADRAERPEVYKHRDREAYEKKIATEAGLEKERERQRLKEQRKRDLVKADIKAHAEFKEKDREYRKKQRTEKLPVFKQDKAECVRIEPFVSGADTIIALAGHFAGDGCVRPESLRVLSATRDVTSAFQRVFGGNVSVCKRGYFTWCLSYGSARDAASILLPYALGKQEQLQEFLGMRRDSQIREMKAVEPAIMTGSAFHGNVFDQFVGGFLGSDGNVHVRGIETFRPVVVFGQKYRQILDLIKENFPGGTEVVECWTAPRRGEQKKKSFRVEYKNVPAMDLIRRVEPYVTASYKRSICRAILEMPPDKNLQRMVWGLQKASKDTSSEVERGCEAESDVDDFSCVFEKTEDEDDDEDE